ncbi:MAG: OmpA family protein, partial [Oscillospiraceae bacterium]|nr:OmpA family protein [Oscillospiraceae bacterium]
RVNFCNAMSYLLFPVADRPLSKLPYRIDVGPHSNVSSLNYLNGYNWMTMQFSDAEGNRFAVRAAYTVQDDQLELRILKDYSYDSKTGTLDYTFSDLTLHYGFSFSGSSLTLTCDGKSVTLHPEDLKEENGVDIYDAHLGIDSPELCGITALNLQQDDPYLMIGEEKIVPESYAFTDDGLFRLKWTDANGPHAVQLVYFYCDDDGLVLTDGTESYYYNRRSWDLYTKDVSTNLDISGAKELEKMSDAERDALISRVDDLYTDLDKALKEAGINASIDKETGEIALDSVLLFDVDAFAVSPEGKKMLRSFLQAYTSVIFGESYDGFVSSIEIEGHSDPTGNPDYNRTLSEYRADNVMAYCLSDENGLDSETTEKLAGMITAQGYSSDRPIYREDGSVDLNASRRVSFRFVIAVDDRQDSSSGTEAEETGTDAVSETEDTVSDGS